MEQWRDIPEYEGIYEVSNFGRVRSSKDKTTKSALHGERKWKQRILKQKTDKGGYKRVSLWKNKISKDFLVHRLVLLAFGSNPDNKPSVNHIDGNPSNNHLDNLEWVTPKENLIHAFENRLNESADPVILYDTINKEVIYFYSKSQASQFLGRNKGYISGVLKQGENSVDNYEIFVRRTST